MIFIIIFQPPPPLMIEIIISVNDENDGRPQRKKSKFWKFPNFDFQKHWVLDCYNPYHL